MPLPPAPLINWLKSTYPTLTVDPEWLQACYDYLFDLYPDKKAAHLIREVNSQLLLSDLSTSTLPPSQVLDSSHSPQSTPTLFPSKTLVQLVSINPISHPALSTYDILGHKREQRRMEQLGHQRQVGGGGEDPAERMYPRGMVRVTLSDGRTEFDAVEYEPIDGLDLENCKLGTKIILHNVRLVKGLALLTKSNCVVKGGMVEEFEVEAEALLESTLRGRLGMPPINTNTPAPIETIIID